MDTEIPQRWEQGAGTSGGRAVRGQLSDQVPRGLVTALLRSSDVPLKDRQPPKGHRGHFSGALWAQSEGWVARQDAAGEDWGTLGWSGGSDPQRSVRMSGC